MDGYDAVLFVHYWTPDLQAVICFQFNAAIASITLHDSSVSARIVQPVNFRNEKRPDDHKIIGPFFFMGFLYAASTSFMESRTLP